MIRERKRQTSYAAQREENYALLVGKRSQFSKKKKKKKASVNGEVDAVYGYTRPNFYEQVFGVGFSLQIRKAHFLCFFFLNKFKS